MKTAAAALVLTSVGGVALAATTEVLPAPLTIGSHPADASPGKFGGSEKPIERASEAAAVRDAAKVAAATDRAAAKAGREASYAGLCQAFTASGLDNGRAAERPAFARLVTAAPQGNVAEFCSALAAEAPATKVPAGKAKSPAARDKAADNGKSADAREKAAENGKAADAGKKTADNAKSDATPRAPENDPPRGNGKAADAQRDQRSR
ncbi:MAG: hypothetical protein H0X00_05665 [Sporichthya sp.]|nr:hypothetical protein [Sporichthya sp.]